MIGPMYVGQIPARPFSFTIRDVRTDEPVDLSDYTGVEVTVVDPSGTKLIDREAGQLTTPSEGVVSFTWPSTALSTAGDHQIQVFLVGTNTLDITTPITFEVLAAL